MCLRKALRTAVADLSGRSDVMIWSKGCTFVMRYDRVQAKKISMYIVCASVTLWWLAIGIGVPFLRVVLPLIDSSEGP